MAVEERQLTHQGRVICRQHKWIQSSTPGLLICAKCQTTAKARPREQVAKQPPASPHHVGHYAGLHPEDQPYQSDQFADAQEIDVGDASYYEPPRLPNSTVKRGTYTSQQVIRRGNQQLVIHYDEPPPQYRRRRLHGLFWVGLAMFTMLVGWMLLTTIANWWQVTQDDWQYGRPRTYQIDAVVGHNDSPAHPSHFISINLRGQLEIIEFPGGDATKAKLYLGPRLFGPGQDLIPVTVSFSDVNGDGKPDMLMHVQGQTIVFLNTGSQFASAKP